MIDKVFFVVLVLNTTGLFRFLAPQFGVLVGDVSLVLLVLNIFYLVVKARVSTRLFLLYGIAGWLFVMLLWPLFTLVYSPSFEIREIGLRLYCLSLFLGAVVYTISNGLLAMHRLMSVSLVVTIIGLALSMMMPQYFEAVAFIANARSGYIGRAFGFFMQPNSLATGLVLLFIGWFSLWRQKNSMFEVVAIMAFLLVILLTGSRSGMLSAVIVVTFIVEHSWRKRRRGKLYVLRIGVLIACLVGGVIGAKIYISSIEGQVERQEWDLIDRMETMLSFKLSADGIMADTGSVQPRLNAQAVYWSLVYEKPLFGHGFSSETYYKENHSITTSAHSTALTSAMEYGILYPVVFVLFMIQLYLNRNRARVDVLYQTNSIFQFVFILFFLFMINGGLFDNRTFYVVWGMFFATVNYPRYIFSYNKSTRRIGTWLTRGEISRRFAHRRRLRKPTQVAISAKYGMARGRNLIQ